MILVKLILLHWDEEEREYFRETVMDGLPPSCTALTKWVWYRMVDMQSTFRKGTVWPAFQNWSSPSSHVHVWFTHHLYRCAGGIPELQQKAIPFSFLWIVNAECNVLLKMCLTTELLMPQDRETEEPSARLCLKIKLFIKKIEDKFFPGFFSINHSAEFSLVMLAQFLFIFQLLSSPFWILFWWNIFKYCFERDHNLAEGEIKASG